jgi:hypothetical protein
LAEGERRLVFDTGGKRKHVVRVVYAILALLMGASLFLVVGPFSLGNIFGGASSTNPGKVLEEQAERVETKLRVEPDNEKLLLSLTRARVGAANAQTEVSTETGLTTFTPEGRQDLALAAAAWSRYLKQADEPNPSGALLMARAYFGLAESSEGLEEADVNIEKAAATQRLAAEAQPSVGSLSTLAIYEYYAGNFSAGDKAAKQAAAKVPKSEAKEINKQMAEYRTRGKALIKQKAEFAKLEKSQSKEALQNSLGGLGGSLGQ